MNFKRKTITHKCSSIFITLSSEILLMSIFSWHKFQVSFWREKIRLYIYTQCIRDFEMCHLQSFIKLFHRVVILHGEIIRKKASAFSLGNSFMKYQDNAFFGISHNIMLGFSLKYLKKAITQIHSFFFQSFTRNSTHHP